jgi:hypothetical protein
MMKTNPVYRHGALVAILLTGAGCLILANGTAAEARAKADASKPAKPPIEQGMSAEEVRKLIGEPLEIKPIAPDATEVSGEKWVYRRKLHTETTTEPVRSETLPAYLGPGMGENGMGTVISPIYRLKHTTFMQVTALLMVDGQLVTARQWVEQEVSYEG